MELDDLVLAVLGGDSRAWNELGPRLMADLDSFFQRWFSEADARDLTQITLMIVARKLPEFEVQAGRPFHRWVRAIARTQVKEAFRQRHRERRLADELAEIRPTPATKLSSKLARVERLELVVDALDELDSRYRRAVEHDLQGGDAGTFAELEQIKRGSARTRRRRAYRMLREIVRERGHGARSTKV